MAGAAVDGVGGGAVGAAHGHASRNQVAGPRAARSLLRGEARAEGEGRSAGPRRVVQHVACGSVPAPLWVPAVPPDPASPFLEHPPDAGTGVRWQLVFGPWASVERCDGAAGPVGPPRADPDVRAHSAQGWGALTACGTCGQKVAAPAPPPTAAAERTAPLQLLATPGAGPIVYPRSRGNKPELSRPCAGAGALSPIPCPQNESSRDV